jgi:hypothetical protein
MDESTAMSDKAMQNGQLPVQTSQESWATVPKRKPVPLAKGPSDAEATAVNAGTKDARASADAPKRVCPFSLSDFSFSFRAQRRSRKFLIIGIVAAVLLIVLIIGLAVGLTVGEK